MAKKKSKSKKMAALAWCWYCDRTFEDQRVLLSHQKAKHFRCSMCPRRLNTAGGLSVHLDQVHKVPADKIENALPGRDTFDVEIYGMEGVPAPDLAAWKKKQAEELGLPNPDEQKAKRPRYAQVALTAAEARTQLASHRELMGITSAAPVANIHLPAAQAGVPPPGFGTPISASASATATPMPPPPGGLALPPGFPPGFPMPPPGVSLPPGMPPIPGMPMPPPGMPLPPGFPAGLPPPPIPGMPFPPPGMPFPPPGMPLPPGFPAPPGFAPPSGPVPPGFGLPNMPKGSSMMRFVEPPRKKEKVQSSKRQLKPGTMLVYGDEEVSPDEKRAALYQYRVEDEPELAAAPSTAGAASATGPSASEAVGNVASAATEGAPASVVTGDAGDGKVKLEEAAGGGGDPLTGGVATGSAVGSAEAPGGGRKRARAADLID